MHTYVQPVCARLSPAGLLTEIINSRLFTTVRDTLGLTYDVSFELSLFDRLPSGEQLIGGPPFEFCAICSDMEPAGRFSL